MHGEAPRIGFLMSGRARIICLGQDRLHIIWIAADSFRWERYVVSDKVEVVKELRQRLIKFIRETYV